MRLSTYHKLTPIIIKDIVDIIGGNNVFVKEYIPEKYSYDESERIRFFPEAVVKPKTDNDVINILKLANKHRICVTPRGAGTGINGGAVPIKGGILISLEDMKKLDIDTSNLMAVVEPGVITGKLKYAVEQFGLFYPPDPASLENCTIGGNVSTNAGGPKAFKYGSTKNYVAGINVVLADGRKISLGGKFGKNSTGYKLMELLIGSEGTLGIITEVILKLLPMPETNTLLLISYNDISDAAGSISEIIKKTRIIPSAVEFIDKKAIELSNVFYKKNAVFGVNKDIILLELDGRKRDIINDAEKIGEICLENNALDIFVANDKEQQNKLWEARRNLLEAVKSVSPINEVLDTVVPRNHIGYFMKTLYDISLKHNITIVNFGHAGDGNIHIHILKMNMKKLEWDKKVEIVVREIYDVCKKLGGVISGEHGVGVLKKQYMKNFLGEEQVNIMRNIKKVFDQNYILNPAKIFD